MFPYPPLLLFGLSMDDPSTYFFLAGGVLLLTAVLMLVFGLLERRAGRPRQVWDDTGALMETCPECGASVPSGNRYCPECGAELNGYTPYY